MRNESIRQRRGWLSGLRELLHRDFCPWANRYVYWLKRPIGWFVIGIAATILMGLHVSVKAFLASAVLGAIAVAGLSWPLVAFWAIRGELAWGRARCEEGDEVDVCLTITNRWPFPVWGLELVGDAIVSQRLGREGEPVSICRVPGLCRNEYRWKVKAMRRGMFPERELSLSTSFPFGLFHAQRVVAVRRALIVWPKIFRMLDTPSFGGKVRSVIGASSPQIGHDYDWSGFRPFREGDSLRSVHWAQTARRDSLIVCERESCCKERIVIRVPRGVEASCTSDEQREWLLRILASLAKQFLIHAWDVEAVLGDRSERFPKGHLSLADWLDHLAAFRWSDLGESPIPPNEFEDRSRRRSTSEIRGRQEHRSYQVRISTPTFETCARTFSSLPDSGMLVLVGDSLDHSASETLECWPCSSPGTTNIFVYSSPTLPEALQSQWQRFCQHAVAG